MNREETLKKYGQRVQRCSGCYGAFYLKDMWLGPEASYYCENCREDTMFHFDEFTENMDLSQFSGEEESTQCQNPFTRQV